VLFDHRFDFFQFDPQAADLYLEVYPAQKLDPAVRQVPCQVPSFVHARSGLRLKWIRHERQGRSFLVVQISFAHTNPAYTGDRIKIAEKVGAFVDYSSFCLRLMGPMFMVDNRTYSGMAVSPYSISVNLLGKRYASEPLIGHMDQFNGGHVVGKQPKGAVFALFSENIMKSALELGNGDFVIADPVLRGQELPETIEECHNDIKEALATQKNCFRADTLEDLADILGIDKAGLLETIANYNRYCEDGFDWGFYKPESTLIPFNEGPYYAVSGFMATDGAFGGVKVNSDMQAYGQDDNLIEGLYVSGDFASGRHINLGGVKRQFINDMNWSLAGSYIVGDRVVRYLASLGG
jgi:hypothetical protein